MWFTGRKEGDDVRQPAMFLAQGSPMLALQEGDDYHLKLRQALSEFPRPRAIVVQSSHWTNLGPVMISGAQTNRAAHDFSGFPEELYSIRYEPPGNPTLAMEIFERLNDSGIRSVVVEDRALDSGAWIPLRIAFPDADVPVVLLSLPLDAGAASLTKMGQALRLLREEGVMLVGTGAIVNNPREVRWAEIDGRPPKWATDFQEWFVDNLLAARISELLAFESFAPGLDRALPRQASFLPVFLPIGASLPGDAPRIFNDRFQYGAMSLLSFLLS